MRKANSDFKTAFISEAGAGVVNNDYFGFVELDEFACYVIADGLYEMEDAEGARLAIEAVIQKFQEHPSLRKSVLKEYLDTANRRLLEAEKKRISMKASVTVVVTNYEKMRYACAGNARMYLYRSGEALTKSRDMSLAREELEKEHASTDLLARHKERNNLYCYLGQPAAAFKPYVSEMIKLQESDIITLFTRGVWEHVDDGEMHDVFSDTTDDPQESVDVVEELLLSRQPDNLENYTVAAIFVNKVFNDPNARKKRKRIIIISVIAALVIVIIIVVVLLYQRDRRQKREAMFDAVNNAITFIQHDNYTKALSESETAYELAEKLKDKDMQADTLEYIKLAESILKADELLKNGDYDGAVEAYRTAQEYAMKLNKAGLTYIERKMLLAKDYMRFYDFMELGDVLADLGQHDEALDQYRQAQNLASSLYFPEGKQQALDAIEKLYGEVASAEDADKAKKDEEAAAAAADAAEAAEAQALVDQEKADEAKSAEELLAEGDGYFGQQEYEQAKAYYQMARDKFSKLLDTTGIARADGKIKLAENKLSELAQQKSLAASYMNKGDDAFSAKNYDEAKKNYNLAKQIYLALNMTAEAAGAEEKLLSATAAIEKQDADRQSMLDEIAAETLAAAELVSKGDAAFEKGDFNSALSYYTLAYDKYTKLGDTAGQLYSDTKVKETQNALSKDRQNTAGEYHTEEVKSWEGAYGY